MCLILVAWQVHRDYPLVVAANRDEFFARPTAAAAFWTDVPDILAGRDLEAGGTWLGVTRRGRFAALTNYRDPACHRPGASSRGLLVADFLRSGQPAAEFVAALEGHGPAYNGFNLIVSDGKDLVWHSNVAGQTRRLAPGIYGISNHLLDTPWPKVEAAKSALAAALTALPDDAALFHLLRDDTVHADNKLPRTGVSLEWERLLSAAFVKAAGYGTRNSTVLLQSGDGRIILDEQTWLENAVAGMRRRFSLPTAAAS